MARFHSVLYALVLTTILLTFGCSQKEPVVASPDLWKTGDWVLYDISRIDKNNQETSGTLKLSSVGQEMIEGQPYYWLEIREDNSDGTTITKFLAREVPHFDPEKGFTFWDDVKRIIVQKNAGQPEEVPVQHLRRYTPHFIEGGNAKRFGNVEELDPPVKEILESKTFDVNGQQITTTGIRNVQHYASSVNLGFLNLEDTTESSVEFYRSLELPFGGIVTVAFKSKTTSVNKLKPDSPPKPPVSFSNEMTLKAFGTNAESQITGTPKEMEVMPFPFLEAARKNASAS